MPVLATLSGEGIAVFSGSFQALDSATLRACRPVYGLGDDTLPAVPTGRVFVQGAKDTDLARVVAALGYEIESVPDYAPQAAWIVAADRTIATALADLGGLIATPEIESVEPQMLRPVAYRGDGPGVVAQ